MEYLPQDPHMLVSVLNMKLRDQYSDLDDLCQSLGLNRAEIEAQLAKAQFYYHVTTHQFISGRITE